MVYKATKRIYDFRKFKTIRAFCNEIRNDVINDDMAIDEQNKLIKYIEEFSRSTRTNNPESKKIKKEVIHSTLALLQGRGMVFTAFKIEIFPRFEESQEGEGLKILTPDQMLKRLPIALAQIKSGNNSKTLLNEIRQIIYSLYPSKEITKKVYNNIIKSIKI